MTEPDDPARLLAQGRLAEAEAECERRLALNPDDLPSLILVALGAIRAGEVRRALVLLERAVGYAPGDATLQHHLGRARELAGDAAGALAADEAAVRAAPDNALARLHYAMGLERHGETARASLNFIRALNDAQAGGRWMDATSTPAALRPLVEHALQSARRSRKATLATVLEPLIARYGRASLARVEAAIRIYVGEQLASYPDARQRPTFFYVPGLPPASYFDRRMFAWIPAYEAAYRAIRGELEALLPRTEGRERVFGSDALEDQNLRGERGPPTWNGYYFFRHGERRADNCSACPATAAALEQIELMRVREHGPEVLFSVFTAGTHLLPHRGVTNARAVSHLPLIVPADCALKVGGELHEWQEGRVVVFDDTYEHEAWNRSASVRVVLIADVWNPHLDAAERAAIGEVIAAIGDQHALLAAV